MLIKGLNLMKKYMPNPTSLYNDNQACIVIWSRSMTTKGLQHVQIQEKNAVRESQCNGFITTKHCQGKYNLSAMFPEEDKDTGHFIEIRHHIMADNIPEELDIERNILTARRVISEIHCSHPLLLQSEGGVKSMHGQTL